MGLEQQEEAVTRKMLELQSEIMNRLVRSGMNVSDAVRTVLGASYNCFFDAVLLNRKLQGESLDLDWKKALSDLACHETTAHRMMVTIASRLEAVNSKWSWSVAIAKRQRALGEK